MAEKLTLEEKIELHRRMAESYHHAYDKKAVKDGATYDAWKFADNADYWSPYFGNETINLKTNPISVAASATMEAKAYSLVFPDWGPIDFECWPSPDGFAMKTHFVGHTKEGKEMSFFTYSYVRTNENGEIVHWETHNDEPFSDFLEMAIGVRGPFLHGADEYIKALEKALSKAGVKLEF